MAYCTIGIYHFVISAFLEPHHHHKASDHLIIAKLMHHFYLQHSPSWKQFGTKDVKHLLSLCCKALVLQDIKIMINIYSSTSVQCCGRL